jgi:glycosyltransferase involved in cell wall biosynthesis
MSVQISAVICTRNRAPYLRRALQGLLRQTLPPECFEILIVDNDSTDDTRDVVCTEFAAVSNLRYIAEIRPGLSRARNTGYREARGDYVAYLDDDAIPFPQWLEAILNAFRTTTPQPGCVSGKIKPIWEAARPKWLHDRMVHLLTILDVSDEPVILRANQYGFGANIAFRRDVLDVVGGFPPELGRQGNVLLGSEDTFIQSRVRELGYSCYYHPQVAVLHHVHPHRLRQGWFLRRLYYHGVSKALERVRLQQLSDEQRLCAASVEFWTLLLSPGRLANVIVPTNDSARFRAKCLTLASVGYLVGLLSSKRIQVRFPDLYGDLPGTP